VTELQTPAEVSAAFAAISVDAIGTGTDGDGERDFSDDWSHPSAAAAREVTRRLGMEWDFTTWEDARARAESLS